ncbi:hypothetical protein EJB05_36285, partial [Eragrostis curvula]
MQFDRWMQAMNSCVRCRDMQSYVSRAFLYLAPLSKKVFILVDNQPWLTRNQARSARLWQFMVTKIKGTISPRSMQYRMSPFVNSRALLHKDKDTTKQQQAQASAATGAGAGAGEWFTELSLALHGFLVFEVSWRDVHGINYYNELLTDTSLALEARYMNKWEFHSAEQAAGCTRLWFPGQLASSEATALRGHLRAQCSAASSEQEDDDHDDPSAVPTTPRLYSDTLLQFRFRDSLLPLKLRQIIMSDIRLLTLLESGLPPWVIFFQSYPLLCHLYRPWMRPLARTLYLLASLATVLIGFYDLYKNVPLLRAAAARIAGPLFGWIEAWDMVSRIQYLGTILFLRNLRKFLQSLLALLRTAASLLAALAAPVVNAAAPLVAAAADVLAAGVGPAWALAVDLAEALWTPVDVVLDHVAGCLWPLLQVAMLPARCAAKVAGAAGSLLSATYNFGKDMWETITSIFEINHMSEAQQSAFDMSLLKALWNDLFSQIFRAIRGILNGILVFFASCNRHRLRVYSPFQPQSITCCSQCTCSIYNHVQSRLRHMLRVTGLERPPSCRCKTKHRSGKDKQDDDAVECDVCK